MADADVTPFNTNRSLRPSAAVPVAIMRWVAVLVVSLLVGTMWHEIVGHGLTGVACGGRIEWVELLGFRIWPDVQWQGKIERYGACDVSGIDTQRAEGIVGLGGSMSTWAVAVISTALLWRRRWGGIARFGLIATSLWWIDLMTYTLPSWGLRRSLFFGAVFSEPVVSAGQLGIPAWVVQTFAIVTSAALAVMLVLALRRHRTAPSPSDQHVS